MLFSSLPYLAFLAGVFLLYHIAACRCPRASLNLLFCASLFFYAWWRPSFLVLLLLSIVGNYYLGIGIRRYRAEANKWLLCLGILLNLIPLLLFKYTNFLLSIFDALILDAPTHRLELFLPLGISFFTFQQIAYLVDCHKEEVRNYSFAEYGLFVSFWPQLIAGPIVHHRDLLPQLLQQRRITLDNFMIGLAVFSIGVFKKIVIADTFGVYADWGWGGGVLNGLTCGAAWLVTVSYTLQLYFDFSGYCDMAIGSAALFGIWLPYNFNSPYWSCSIQDFWRRWHMTLSRWLRDYLYIPLGGNRCGNLKTLRNVFLTFLIGGIWHGAGWTFVAWGAMHGLALCVHRIWSQYGKLRMPRTYGWLMTIFFVHLAWVLFRAPDLSSAMLMFSRMFALDNVAGTFDCASGMMFQGWYWIVMGIAIVVLVSPNVMSIIDSIRLWSGKLVVCALLGGMSALLLLSTFVRMFAKGIPQSPFLYFQF